MTGRLLELWLEEESDGLDGMKSSSAILAGFLDGEEKGFYNFKPGNSHV